MLQTIIQQRRRDLGGMQVGRVLPAPAQHMVGPFIFFDHLGPLHMPAGLPRSTDVRPHPHIGLSTVTYLFSGEIMHRDSLGVEQPIRRGEINWMTAGRGITHSERFERARARGDDLHGIQAWVALPAAHEETDPAFAHFDAEELVTVEERGVWMRLLAGEAFGLRSAVSTHSPLFYVHWELKPDASVQLPLAYRERAVYVASGSVETSEGRHEAGQMLVFAPGSEAHVTARSNATLMGLGGEPVGTRFIDWNFVSSSKQRIEAAKADWRAGRMKLPDLDHEEFIPLP
jgi:redox-sensitive bicupin YhaK (pirin superfamily)